MRGDVIWNCLAWAVTPVHVGSGEPWTKQNYVVRDGRLCRFEPSAAVTRMHPAKRRDFAAAVDRGDLAAATRLLQEAVPEELLLERIPLGPGSGRDLRDAQRDAKRLGEVMPMMRSGGRPFIPGSSIKGAIRTALLNAAVQEKGPRHAPGRTDELQQWAFAYERGHTEQDPFRFLEVSDAPLPEGATRIDRVINWRPDGKDTATKIQIHVERLLACADAPAKRFEVTIRIDSGRLAAVSKHDARKAPHFDGLAPDRLVAAVNSFSWGRWKWEIDKFFDPWRQALEQLVRVRAGDKILESKDLVRHPRIMLLRVGRFTQFESKSVDGIRRGVIRLPKGETKHAAEGSTRNVVFLPPRGKRETATIPVPMGWMLLFVREARNG